MTYSRRGNYKLATFMERENRFVVRIKYEGRLLRCHLPNPGRMVELLHEGETEVIFEPVVQPSSRKTDGTVIGIKIGKQVINLDTMLFSELLPHAIANDDLPLFEDWKVLAKEQTIGNHRFDFILDINKERVIAEVKSTTRVIDRTACFPDAVSKRATNHITTLYELSKKGDNCLLIFTVYHSADRFQPCLNIDPTFTKTFYSVIEEVDAIALQIKGLWVNSNCSDYSITGTIPIIDSS